MRRAVELISDVQTDIADADIRRQIVALLPDLRAFARFLLREWLAKPWLPLCWPMPCWKN